MANIFYNTQFLLIAGTNFCLFLIVSTLSFLPVIIVEMGGSKVDVGIVMGAIGITTLGTLPLVAPLIDKHGRKKFMIVGVLLMGLSNAGFLFFSHYSPLMVLVRLAQGVAFGACFNACATAIVDIVEPAKRAQGIGFFGVSGSMAVAVGPYIGELFLTRWGHTAYFTLLIAFGVIGMAFALAVKEPPKTGERPVMHGFFNTALQPGYPAMMAMAVIFGSGFAAMNNFLPLQARSMGFSAGLFFVWYGISLIAVRILLGTLLDRVNRDRIILVCLVGFGINLGFTSQIHSMLHVCLLGALFGVVQGISYPAMMARMVDRSNESNRAVVVALFTGSFGVGINLSVLVWGVLADLGGLPFMFMAGSALMFIGAVASMFFFAGKRRLPVYNTNAQ